ncbi:helix-turn-helix transcriptional regulator [Vibrio sp. 10N.222.54.F12]|uniref:AraC family transcriptional regulator n=1 Tax=Vibrio TaxID=662 RepID=UPI000C84D71F|nr:helix-turn-helix transcriptional regulator [Vibrio tasmaniensis]PML19337.1 AraC family transcriptional regulator [Vibrio tasmaniensis]
MAFINETTVFDVDSIVDANGIKANVVGIAADLGQHDSGTHQHNKGQLLYAPYGCITLTLDNALCILPPTKAVWIPPHVPHRAQMTNVVSYRSLYFDTALFECPTEITTVKVDDLLKALINKIALWDWDIAMNKTTTTCTLFWEEFNQAKQQSLVLPLPTDRRLKRFSEQVGREDFLLPPLNELAQSVGASTKTITRLFRAETGMTYQDWRQQWRLIKSIELLAQHLPVSDVAHRLEFSSDSAFIAFFKQQTGQTPLAFTKLRT